MKTQCQGWPGRHSRPGAAPHAVMEAALSHVVRNKVEAAYARSDLFERRRALMEGWAKFLACGMATGSGP